MRGPSSLFLASLAVSCSLSWSSKIASGPVHWLSLLAKGDDLKVLKSFQTSRNSRQQSTDEQSLSAGFVYVKYIYRQWVREMAPSTSSAQVFDELDVQKQAESLVRSFVTRYPVRPQNGAHSTWFVHSHVEQYVSRMAGMIVKLRIANADKAALLVVQGLLKLYLEFTSAVAFVFRDLKYTDGLLQAGEDVFNALEVEFAHIAAAGWRMSESSLEHPLLKRHVMSTDDAYAAYSEYGFLKEFKSSLDGLAQLTSLSFSNRCAPGERYCGESIGIWNMEWIRFFLISRGDLPGISMYLQWLLQITKIDESLLRADVQVLSVLERRLALQKSTLKIKLRVNAVLKQISSTKMALESPQKLGSSESALYATYYDNIGEGLGRSLASVDAVRNEVVEVFNQAVERRKACQAGSIDRTEGPSIGRTEDPIGRTEDPTGRTGSGLPLTAVNVEPCEDVEEGEEGKEPDDADSASSMLWLEAEADFIANDALLSVQAVAAEVEKAYETLEEFKPFYDSDNLVSASAEVTSDQSESLRGCRILDSDPQEEEVVPDDIETLQCVSEAKSNSVTKPDSVTKPTLDSVTKPKSAGSRDKESAKLRRRLFSLGQSLERLLAFHARNMAHFVFRLGTAVEHVAHRILLVRGAVFDGRFLPLDSSYGE